MYEMDSLRMATILFWNKINAPRNLYHFLTATELFSKNALYYFDET